MPAATTTFRFACQHSLQVSSSDIKCMAGSIGAYTGVRLCRILDLHQLAQHQEPLAQRHGMSHNWWYDHFLLLHHLCIIGQHSLTVLAQDARTLSLTKLGTGP